jgi:galactoside O-acetyltransferase
MNPFDPGYYSSLELRSFGFARVGENCMVARNCTVIGLANITLGDHVRIDGFTSLIAPKGRIKIGSYVHIAGGCMLGARGGIELGDFSSLSQGVRIFTAIDDFSGNHLSNATVPEDLTGVQAAPVSIGRYVPIGSGSIVLPAPLLARARRWRQCRWLRKACRNGPSMPAIRPSPRASAAASSWTWSRGCVSGKTRFSRSGLPVV